MGTKLYMTGQLIVYSKSCLACTHKKLWKGYKQYARQNGLNLIERRTTFSTHWQEEAKVYREKYGVVEPFAVVDGEVINHD